MIVVIMSTKGGVGKSTTTINLTVMRSNKKKVLLVDGDEQQSAADFTNHRIALDIPTKWTTVSLKGNAIRTEITKLKHDYDDIIIDCGGRDTSSVRAALLVADICIIPFQPKSLDLWTAQTVHDLIEEATSFNYALKAYTFINCAAAKGSDNDEAKNILKEFKSFSLLPITVGMRKSFSNATAAGLGIYELNKDQKAQEEMQALYNSIFKKG